MSQAATPEEAVSKRSSGFLGSCAGGAGDGAPAAGVPLAVHHLPLLPAVLGPTARFAADVTRFAEQLGREPRPGRRRYLP